jgi:hypothetical protein
MDIAQQQIESINFSSAILAKPKKDCQLYIRASASTAIISKIL